MIAIDTPRILLVSFPLHDMNAVRRETNPKLRRHPRGKEDMVFGIRQLAPSLSIAAARSLPCADDDGGSFGSSPGIRALCWSYHSDLYAHRYQHTVHVCGLQKDLNSLPYGDLTEVSRAESHFPS